MTRHVVLGEVVVHELARRYDRAHSPLHPAIGGVAHKPWRDPQAYGVVEAVKAVARIRTVSICDECANAQTAGITSAILFRERLVLSSNDSGLRAIFG
jgi:hypothetical protein